MFGRWNRLLAAALTVSVIGPVVVASTAAASPNSFVLSGQVKGTVTINKSETCSAGNIDTTDGLTTVRIYLTNKDVAPTKDAWYILISSKGKKASFPSSSDTFALGVNSGITTEYEWITSVKLGAGTVAFGAKYKSGIINVTLAPGPNQKSATHSEKVIGNWAC
jgi:hypothetical protein